MEFFPALLTAEETDQAIVRIEKHFEEHGFGSTLRSCGDGTMVAMRAQHSAISRAVHAAVEIGWRFAFEVWGRGWPRGAVRLSIMHSEICGCQVWSLLPYRECTLAAVMEKIGMEHDADGDFEHPGML